MGSHDYGTVIAVTALLFNVAIAGLTVYLLLLAKPAVGLLAIVAQQLTAISQNERRELMTLQEIRDKVAANTSVVGSAVELINGLKDRLDEAIAANDPAMLQAISDELGAQGDALSQAVAENTPAQ